MKSEIIEKLEYFIKNNEKLLREHEGTDEEWDSFTRGFIAGLKTSLDVVNEKY